MRILGKKQLEKQLKQIGIDLLEAKREVKKWLI